MIKTADMPTPDKPKAHEYGPADALRGSHGHKPKARTDIASGEVTDPARMIRIAFGPEGLVVPDFRAKFPGRGAWITPTRAAVNKAIKTGGFSRAAKAKIDVPVDFADMLEAGLRARVLGLLGMANRAGALESGFDKVRGAAGAGLLAYRFEALDGAADGRSKIRVLARAVARELNQPEPSVVGCFDAHALGKIIGRDHAVHIAVKRGRFVRAFEMELSRLSGFTELVPQMWTDKEHETLFVPFKGLN